jgi:NADPH:quinone reductase-like Zn-dependent oxidoreductase
VRALGWLAFVVASAPLAAGLPQAALPQAAKEAQGATMKAIRFHAPGGPEVLRLEDVPRPVPKAGEVLVQVHAAGVNPVDWKIRRSGGKGFGPPLPQIPGFDISGVVAEVGEGVERFAPGEAVFGYLALQRGGAYAEYAIALEGELARKPEKLSFDEAAGVPLAALTAWQALVDNAKLDEGQAVLIHAAAGGVGHFAVQIAKARGAHVIATASQKNHAFLKQLGADEVIDYTSQRFEEQVSSLDVVLDSIGGDTQTRSLGVLAPGGILVSIVGGPPKAELEKRNVRGVGILVHPDGKELEQIAGLFDSGALKIEVSAVLPLAEAAKAHELSEAGHVRGKIVLHVRDEPATAR